MAGGFQEVDKPQSDSPTVAKESLKLLIALAANEGFELASMDISAAFLQGNTLNRDVIMKPPGDQQMEGWLWKLKKPLYIWLKLKVTLTQLGLKIMPGDEAFYYLHKEGE